MSHYKDPGELYERALTRKSAEKNDTSCICPPTGYSLDCTAHEGKDDRPMHKHPNRFPWGTAVLVALFLALLLWEIVSGGFNPLLFPGGCG